MIAETAPAKINLYLHVTGRRADGYHELDSLVAFADAGDVVSVEPGPAGSGPRLVLDGPFAGALAGEDPEGNLVVRAARALAEVCGQACDLVLRLDKRLPIASGIGGGSADAAAVLRALARLWTVPGGEAALLAVAARLGADVPVCVASRPAYFGGIGDVLAPAPALPETHIVLANPGVPVSTPAVFKARAGLFSEPARLTQPVADPAGLARALAARRNDLTGPASSVAPVVLTVLEALAATPGCLLSRLSGSGGTCFALYPDAAASTEAARRLAALWPEWWVRPTALLA
jgi:4-diphosphocytidyl-2-C-methyl-D-erythritol kinase